jgi:hypothetical protein
LTAGVQHHLLHARQMQTLSFVMQIRNGRPRR